MGARLAGDAGGAGEFGAVFRAELAQRAEHAIGLKSVAAYRVGLDLAPGRPTETEVAVAAAHWLDSPTGTPWSVPGVNCRWASASDRPR